MKESRAIIRILLDKDLDLQYTFYSNEGPYHYMLETAVMIYHLC